MSNPDRVMQIFDLLGHGKSTQEISELMQESQVSERKKIGKERKSEKEIMSILSGIDEVTDIDSKYGREEKINKNLRVMVNPIYGHDITYVLIKPSRKAIRSYKRHLSRNSLDKMDVDQWLTEHNMILINSRASEDMIRKSFLSQLAAIRDLHRK